MARRFKPLPLLEGDQHRAADPACHAALSASAGTGKTHVLTARVLRLLLAGVRPEHILCLTFTKAGAAEMANRVGERLTSWVRLDDNRLGRDLFALGEQRDPPALQRARRLFARVLDAPGGLRIQTIHSFAQTLLASFPEEAGIAPGFRAIEGREEEMLARRTLAALIAEAEEQGNAGLIADVQALSRRLGEDGAQSYLMACARAGEALAELPAQSIEAQLRHMLELPEGDIEAEIAERCADDRLDCALLERIAAANAGWKKSATGPANADCIARFLAARPAERAAMLELVLAIVVKQDGAVKFSKGQVAADPAYEQLAADLADAVGELVRLRSAAALAAVQAAGLRAGAAFAAAYARAKRAAGVADFDDLIRWTRKLFVTPGMGEWVRYKLDRQTDHILIDEAQDSNADQWAIVEALADEFFSGLGAAGDTRRTLFMVGDFKQAIFGFQGTDPREFERMRTTVRNRAEALRRSADEADSDIRPTEFLELSIDASFRSAPAVLEIVDAVIETIGYEAMGLVHAPNRHVAHHHDRPGRVQLLRAFDPASGSGDEDGGDDPADRRDPADIGADSGEEGWLSIPERLHASMLARSVRAMLDRAPVMASTGHPLAAGDILILVRSRKELAALIVARLHAELVPVAGIDRLHLSSPLAVQDLLAAIRFAVQPLDDLNLANVLVSPLLGWSQQQLYDLAFGRPGSLWQALGVRASESGHHRAAREALGAILAAADFTTPARLLETILSGPLDGRRKLLRRLGRAARDPIDELVAAALDYERTEIASLDRFIDWFARGDVEIKRDPSAPGEAVRVMTVHGAKGLEAPVVILADATADPANLGRRSPPLDLPLATGPVPVIPPRAAEMIEPFRSIATHRRALSLEEHWRLLYVGLTRASEELIVAGVRPRRGIPADSWYRRVELALEARGALWIEQPPWGAVLEYRGAVASRVTRSRARRAAPPPPPLPDWLRRPAPAEPVPPRPLAPSQLGEELLSSPPPSPVQRAAARRGTLLHALFERLPEVSGGRRVEAALRWLEQAGGVADPDERAEIAGAACAIIADRRFRDLFGPDALAEAPIAATLADGRVVVGTVDRLLIEADWVRLIDFKTGRTVPLDRSEVPVQHLRQMRAYADALEVIFPGRRIDGALLYTAGPVLIALDG